MRPILEASAVSKHYGGANVLDSVSLSITTGTIAGLIGPNGAGKSTLFNIIAGAERPTGGRVFLHGRTVETKPAYARLAGGLGRTFQIPRPFASMTVVENVMLGGRNNTGEKVWANLLAPARVLRMERTTFDRAMELLEFVTLASLAHQPARVLSGGQRKLLELARVLMAEPDVMLLDEPAAGVNPLLLEVIIGRILALNLRGIAFLIVEHNMDLILRLCSHVFVLAAGKLLTQGTPIEVVRHPRVIEAYLGGVAP